MSNSGSCGISKSSGVKLPSVAALMDLGQARAHVRAHLERGIAHAERLEDVLLHVGAEPPAAHGLDHLASPVDVDAVLPALARIGQQRRVQGRVLAADDAGEALCLLVADDLLAPDLVARTRRCG